MTLPHTVTHIIMSGVSAYSRCRPQAPDCFRVAKAESECMRELGIMCPCNVSWKTETLDYRAFFVCIDDILIANSSV